MPRLVNDPIDLVNDPVALVNDEQSIPGAPIIGTATVVGSQQASVSFSPPTNTGGAGALTYTDTSFPGGKTATGSSSPIIVSGLINGASYVFSVKATNTLGTGPSSEFSNSVVPGAVPGAPTIGLAQARDASVSVSFTAPTDNGGSSITSYTATSTPGGITKIGTISPILVTGLTNGTAYTFKVKATNASGTGPESAASNSATPILGGDTGGPTVNVDIASTQVDPAFTQPVYFDIIFSDAVIGFDSTDVVITGTALPTTVVVSGTGATYTAAVSGMSKSGSVVATILAGAATFNGKGNQASSSSTTNAINFIAPVPVAPEEFFGDTSTIIMVCNMLGDAIGQVVGAKVVDPEWELNAPGSAKIEVDPMRPGADLIKINETEVQVWINDELVWWGIPRSMGGDAKKISFQCAGLLDHFLYRYVVTSLLYESIDQIGIGMNLINYGQTGPNMNRNIFGSAAELSGIPRSRHYKAEAKPNILDLLQEFPEVDRGFDFDIVLFPDGRREWTPYYPSKGIYKPHLRLEWGRNITNYKYNEDGTEQGTKVYATGGTISTGAKIEENYEDVALSAKYGVMHRIISEGNQLDRPWLADAAKEEVQTNGRPLIIPELIVKDYPVKLFRQMETGDIVPVRINHGRCQIAENLRVIKIKRIEAGKLALTLNRVTT